MPVWIFSFVRTHQQIVWKRLTYYHICRRCTQTRFDHGYENEQMKHYQTIPIVFALFGSLTFLGLPDFNEFLYVNERLPLSGITRNEWIWTALCTTWVILAFTLPAPKAGSITSERRSFLFFLVVNFLWMVLPLYQCMKNCDDFSAEKVVSMIGAKAAWPALWNVAIVSLPVQRISPILDSIGLSAKQAVVFHIWAASATLIWLLVHAILLSVVYIWRTESISEWLSLMLPYEMYRTEGVVNFMGWLGLLCFIGIWVTARPLVQQKSYETFRILHWVFSALFLIGSNLHDYSTWFFIQPAMIMMVADRILRRYSYLTFEESTHQDSSDECYEEGKVGFSTSGEIASMTIPIPELWPHLYPGMHIYLTVKSISWLQSHPYSISQTNQEKGYFTIYIKALGNWSKEFVVSVEDSCQSPPASISSSWTIEGPYGSPMLHEIVQASKHCIFVAGGVGITGISALAQARCRCTHREARREHDIREYRTTSVLWMVQSVVEADFLVPLLRDEYNDAICGNTHIWITKESNPVTIGNDLEGSRNSPPLRVSRSSRWSPSDQLPKAAVVSATVLSSLLVLASSRFICSSQPSNSAIPYALDYSFLWHSGTCVNCRIEEILDPSRKIPIPCCTVGISYYCFRGLPMLLSFLLMGPLALRLARAFSGLWLGSCGRSFFGYVSISNHNTRNHASSDNYIEEDHPSMEITGRGNPSFSEALLRDGSENIKVHWGKRPENSSTLLSPRYLPADVFSDDAESDGDIVVVVCGPPKLVEATKRELALDPTRRKWRVMVA